MSKKEKVEEQVEKVVKGVPNALVVSMELAEAILISLKSKPMVEVEALVNGLLNSPRVTVTTEPEEPKK